MFTKTSSISKDSPYSNIRLKAIQVNPRQSKKSVRNKFRKNMYPKPEVNLNLNSIYPNLYFFFREVLTKSCKNNHHAVET